MLVTFQTPQSRPLSEPMSAELFRTTGDETLNPQDWLVGAQPNAGVNQAPLSAPGRIDVKQLYQVQINQLAIRLPILAAWLVYRDRDRGTRQSVFYAGQNQSGYDPAVYFFLESEAWLAAHLFTPALNKLASPEILKRNFTELPREPFHAYIHLLHPQDSQPEYLLVWTTQPLSASQQQEVEQVAQWLSPMLSLVKDQARQQAEIQLLEEVLQRTEHQLRSPLALISLYAENLRLGLATHPLQDQAALIGEAVKELSTHLTDLLHCGQREKLRVASHDLRQILIESIKGLQPWINEKQLTVHYPATPATLTVDCWQIKQVFDNLLSNAIHFSPPHTTITWRWHVFQQEVLVEIGDEGPGIASDDLKHIFKPFYSRRDGGTGLGLAIAQKIILDHQGSLWVQNLPGGGAQFSFTLTRKGL